MKTNKLLKKAAATMKAVKMQNKEMKRQAEEIEMVQKAGTLADAVEVALDARHAENQPPATSPEGTSFTPHAPGGYRLAAVGTVTPAQQKANLKDAQGKELSFNDGFNKLMGR